MATKMKVSFAYAMLVMGLAGMQASAATLHVNPVDPAAFNGIQKAIDSAQDGDTIIVHPFVYSEHIDYLGRAIAIRSTDPNNPAVVAGTIIDGGGTGNVASFISGETSQSVLRGVSLTNGHYGVFCANNVCRPQIRQCVIYANKSRGVYLGAPSLVRCTIRDNGGDGIYESSGQTRECTISGNQGFGVGRLKGAISNSVILRNASTGILCDESPSSITQCVVSENALVGINMGGDTTSVNVKNSIISGNGRIGVNCYGGALVTITNCTIVGNYISGIYMSEGAGEVTVTNSIIARNMGAGAGGMPPATSKLTLRYNDFYSNHFPDESKNLDYNNGVVPGTGDIREDPQFTANGEAIVVIDASSGQSYSYWGGRRLPPPIQRGSVGPGGVGMGERRHRQPMHRSR